MKEYLEKYRLAVEQAIKTHHARGQPAYQCKGGYIVAIYPNGKEIKLQKSTVFTSKAN